MNKDKPNCDHCGVELTIGDNPNCCSDCWEEMQNIMNKRLVIKIEKHNKKWNKIHWYHNSMRIVFGTLKPNCDNSLKRSNQ